ncbi:MAG: hypothetical protein U0871_18685 [Gemmataceae bacterium]
MSPQEFLAKAHDRWHTLPDTALAECSDEERAVVRNLEAQLMQMEFAALADIILNCHNRFQFAKTYKALWNDFRRTLAQPGNPNASDQVNRGVKAAMEKIVRQKLMDMAGWFEINFADSHDQRQIAAGRVRWSIEVYAGKEGTGGSGCAGMVLLVMAVGMGTIAFRLV